ncbi:SubName: Full=Related to kinesin light chain {ECO:0000313/EMBL:CCA76161.1} [Serendipita indica DSM 11827]|nr:SubName: Full=Related to kinesin light chain {ECO:0000313/EMBL:CCA76161.1} [Serendipita indica DSM 11827]
MAFYSIALLSIACSIILLRAGIDQYMPLLVSSTSAVSTSKPQSKLEEFGFLEISAGTNPIVDIIAIHGLQGHREKTWTTDDGVFWLRDLLPSDLSNARVLSYGYDADTRSRECVSTQTMSRHAEGFANALSRVRKDAPRRPIIFVAHDIGGIILKWTLVICHNQRLESKGHLRDILVSTHGILFFGTPHFGVEGTTFLEGINFILSVYMATTDAILKDLRSHSTELENIQRFWVAASEKISIIFFCEGYAMAGVGNRGELNVPYYSATIAGDRNAATIVLHANHRNLVRFSSKENDNYITVHYYLKEYINNAPLTVQKKWNKEDELRNTAKGESEESMTPKPRPLLSRTYIERKGIESLITKKLLPESRGKHQPRCILYGLGGAGKTQLATNWVQEHEDEFTRVIMVDASSQSQLEADLARSIRSLGPEYSKMTWKDAVAYLDGKEKGWLLYVDNADSPELDLLPYLPHSIHGATLITTRNVGCVNYAPDGAVHVGGLEESEAVNLLHTTANITPTSDVESLEIVRELGMLALAITQAGAYIRKTRSLDTYLETFRQYRDRLLRKQPDIGTEYAFSTYTAFDLSFNELPANTQDFLKLCAFLHHSLIPKDLFKQSIGSGFTTYTVRDSLPPPESDKTFISNLRFLGRKWDEITFQEIVDSASQASFIDVSTDGSFYTVHPLLQMYIKDRLAEEGNRRYMRMTVQLLLGAIRPVKDSNEWFWQLLPHVDSIPRSVQSESVAHALAFYKLYYSLGRWKACQELLEPVLSRFDCAEGKRDKESVFVMDQLADLLWKDGQLGRAENMQREVLDWRLEILGRRHPSTISAMNNLASIQYHRGRLDEAEKMQREVLDLQLEILGPRHPDTISAVHNLANTVSDRGQLDEAEKMRGEVLDLQLEILGRRHPDTIMAMSNLANTLSNRGQWDDAEKMRREILDLRLEILGPHHPDTISAMGNLANTLSDCGRLDEAEKMQREVLELRLKMLGTRHPETIMAMNNLANTLSDRGHLDEAEKMRREILDLRLEVLGPRHPDTIMAVNNLANTLYDRGRLDEAEKMQREVLDLRLEILGPRHPGTISAMHNLANTLSHRGRLDKAEKMQREVLDLRLEILGRRHPGTISAMNNLSSTLSHQGRLDEAEKMQREVLDLQLEILGPRHPATIATMSNIASILSVRGRLDEAEKIQREVLNFQLEILGPRHPDTISAMINLASTLFKRGHLATSSSPSSMFHESGWLWEARNLLQEVVNLCVEVLGEDHPTTLKSKVFLKHIISEQSRAS